MDNEQIKDWTKANSEGLMLPMTFTDDEIDHISMCLEHIVKWYEEDYPLGSFLTAVVRNDFCEACLRADDINIRALYLYALFLHNRLPSDWRKKALATC